MSVKSSEVTLNILYLNTRGQTKFTLEKQMQIEDIIKFYKVDILHLQETDIDDNAFSECTFIRNNYTVINNNNSTGYGTSSLVKGDLKVDNVSFDTEGRVIVFDIGNITFSNVYLEAGTDAISRTGRENYCGEVIPNLLVNRSQNGYIGGDWNCIVSKVDATHYPESKMSPCLKRLCKAYNWKDSHRINYPDAKEFSHYYEAGSVQGATRIDRQYNWGLTSIISSEYIPVSFSDHFALLVNVSHHTTSPRQNLPRVSKHFKIRDEVASDQKFSLMVADAMERWNEIRRQGLDILTWWELVVKPGLRDIAFKRSQEINEDRRGELNLLLIKQAYYVKKLRSNQEAQNLSILTELKMTQAKICAWYKTQSEKIQTQSRKDEFQSSEATRIYHHELHRQFVKRGLILKLETSMGVLEGHEACAKYLESKVQDLVGQPAMLDVDAQDTLLSLVTPVFSANDNIMLEALPTKAELHKTLVSSNLKAAAGCDGIPGIVYKECWKVLGDHLLDVMKAIFSGQSPTISMRTAMMKFCTKPKKADSLRPEDKRRISILNCDFKLYEGLIARRFRSIGSRVLSPLQYVAGGNRTIQHGILRARDAIYVASSTNQKCGIGDQDYIAAFDYLALSWVWKVLEKKGVSMDTIWRLERLYAKGITIPIINEIPRKAIHDLRGSLRQGGCGSMEWFAFGIDPLLHFLENNLTGILVSSLSVSGPASEGEQYPLPDLEERFKAMAYCDDVKPAICSLEEFNIADKGAALFERSAGTKLHRDPQSNKCKFLPLGGWRRSLTQDQIPTPYMKLTDKLDMVGVQLCSTWNATRSVNGSSLCTKIKNICGSWRIGKFMPLTMRPFSANCYALSKLWFRCASVNLRVGDITSINSSVKKWLYADMLIKPDEIALLRPIRNGGLGLISIKHKAMATLIRSFMEVAANPNFLTSQYLNLIYRAKILSEDLPQLPLHPCYSHDFFQTIRNARDCGNDIMNMSTKAWYNFLIQDVLNILDDNQSLNLSPCRIEQKLPELNWPDIWLRARTKGLSSEATSFCFRMLHDLLPTEQRLSSILKNVSSRCKFPCQNDDTADLSHCLLTCNLVQDVGRWLITVIGQLLEFQPEYSNIIYLNLDLCDGAIWLIVNTLLYSWKKRSIGRRATVEECYACLTSDLNILRDTKHFKTAELALDILSVNCPD